MSVGLPSRTCGWVLLVDIFGFRRSNLVVILCVESLRWLKLYRRIGDERSDTIAL